MGKAFYLMCPCRDRQPLCGCTLGELAELEFQSIEAIGAESIDKALFKALFSGAPK